MVCSGICRPAGEVAPPGDYWPANAGAGWLPPTISVPAARETPNRPPNVRWVIPSFPRSQSSLQRHLQKRCGRAQRQ